MSTGDVNEPAQLFADISFRNGVLTAVLVGPSIGQREGAVISKMVRAEIDAAPAPVSYVVLDCGKINFLNSAGLGSFIEIHNAAKARQGKIGLYRLSDDLKSVFKMTRLDKLFKMIDNEKALAKAVG